MGRGRWQPSGGDAPAWPGADLVREPGRLFLFRFPPTKSPGRDLAACPEGGPGRPRGDLEPLPLPRGPPELWAQLIRHSPPSHPTAWGPRTGSVPQPLPHSPGPRYAGGAAGLEGSAGRTGRELPGRGTVPAGRWAVSPLGSPPLWELGHPLAFQGPQGVPQTQPASPRASCPGRAPAPASPPRGHGCGRARGRDRASAASRGQPLPARSAGLASRDPGQGPAGGSGCPVPGRGGRGAVPQLAGTPRGCPGFLLCSTNPAGTLSAPGAQTEAAEGGSRAWGSWHNPPSPSAVRQQGICLLFGCALLRCLCPGCV